jgi:hypothetical protein
MYLLHQRRELTSVNLPHEVLEQFHVGDVVAFDGDQEALGDDEIDFAVLRAAVPLLEARVAARFTDFS